MADLALTCLVGALGAPGAPRSDAASAADASTSPLARTLAALESEGDLHARRRLVAALRLGVKAAAAKGGDGRRAGAPPAILASTSTMLTALAADGREDATIRRLALEGMARLVGTAGADPSSYTAVALAALAAPDPALRAAGVRLVALAAHTAPHPAHQAAARAALRSHTADPDPGVRAASLDGLVHAAPGLRLPRSAHAVAVEALADDAPGVRLGGVRLLVAAAAAAGATAPVQARRAQPHPTHIAASRAAAADDAAAAAADAAFAAAAGALADPHLPVRVAAVAALGALIRASPAIKAGALSKKTTARTMEGQSVDDAAMVVGPGAASGGGLGVGGLVTGGGGEGYDDGPGADAPAPPTLTAASTAAAVAAAFASADDWASFAGAFVHGLEDDAAAVRGATLQAMASLGAADRAWAPLAAPFAADCAGDESPGVRAAALTCLASLLGAGGGGGGGGIALPLDPHLGAALAGLADTDPAVRRASCGLLGCARLQTLGALGSAVDALLEAVLADARARGGRLEEEEVAGSSGDGGGGGRGLPATPLAALAALGASTGGPATALIPDLMGTRTGFIQAEPSVDNPAYAARLAFALAACAGSGGSTAPAAFCGHPALAALLPAHALGGAAVVLAGRHGKELPLPVGGMVELGRGAVLVGARRPPAKKRRVEETGEDGAAIAAVAAALATLATAPASAFVSTDAALAPLMDDLAAPAAGAAALARLYVRGLAVVEAAKRASGGGGGGGGDTPATSPPPVPAWPASSAARLPCLTAAGTPVDVATASARLNRLADLMACGVAGGEGAAAGAVAGLEAAAVELRARGALPPPWPRPPPPTSLPGLSIVRGILHAPGGPHSRPVAGVVGLPLRLPVGGRVWWAGGCAAVGGDRLSTPRAWLSVAHPLVACGTPLLLPLSLEGAGGGSSSYALPPHVDLPAAPGAPAATLTAALLVQAGVRAGSGRPVLVQVAPERGVTVRAGRAADANMGG